MNTLESTGKAWDQLEEKVDSLVKTLFEPKVLAGMTVAVTKAGRLILSKGYGYALVDGTRKFPMKPCSRSKIGSVTKLSRCVIGVSVSILMILATSSPQAETRGLEQLKAGVSNTASALTPLKTSRGFYRVPYADGTSVKVNRDHNSHTPRGRYDMVGTGGGPYKIVAAAPGEIMAIEDTFSERQDSDTAEQCNNNYVWIAHPNGEWTKYSHMVKGSTTGKAKMPATR